MAFFAFYFLKLLLHNFSKIESQKKAFLTIFD